MWQNIPLWPREASTIAGNVDALYLFLVLITGGVTLLVFGTLTFFLIKYRHSKHPVPEVIEGSTPLEIAWSVIPLGIFLLFFVWGASIYVSEARPPKDAMEVYLVAKQWMWKFEYQNGQREINSLHVPVNRPVRLTMISQDVIHSFYVPEIRVKTDVLPGRYTTTWFQPTKAGTYHLFCAEYCGTGHSAMTGQIVVMEPVPTKLGCKVAGNKARWPRPGRSSSRSLAVLPAIVLTPRDAVRTCRACMASLCCWTMAAR